MEVGSKVLILDGGYVGIVYMNEGCGEGDYPWHIVFQDECVSKIDCYNSEDLRVLGWVGPIGDHGIFEHPLTALLEELDVSKHLHTAILRFFKEQCLDSK